MVLLAKDRETLAAWCEAIQEFLRKRLQLMVRPEMTTPFPVKRGIDFVGWKTWWNHRLPRRQTLSNLAARLQRFGRTAVQTALGGLAQRVNLRRQKDAALLHSMLASYAGHLKHGAAITAWKGMWAERPWLEALFDRRGWTFTRRLSGRAMIGKANFHRQYWALARDAGEHSLVFFQVGRFIEFYGPQRLLASRLLGLRPVPLHRAKFAFTAGFPIRLVDNYFRRALRQGLSVVAVPQVFIPHDCALARRVPSTLLIPPAEGSR